MTPRTGTSALHGEDPRRREALAGAVADLYRRNRQRGHAHWCDRDYDFVCPSRVTYPFQWFWDSCFHAVVLSHLDPARAASEIRGLLAHQQDDGFIPHVILWQRERFEEAVATYALRLRTPWLSDQMQPPVLAEALAAVADRGGDGFLEEVLPAVTRFYEWCAAVRDPDGDGLIAVLQPDETGLDHSPKFDPELGITTEDHADFTAAWHRVADPYTDVEGDTQEMFALDHFVVEDVMVNTLYAENLRVLADLLDRVGDPAAATFRERSRHTARALVDRCFDDRRGLFLDLAGRDERPLTTNTVTSLFPVLLPDLDEGVVDRLVTHLEDPAEYAARYPVPSVAMDEAAFRPGTVGGNLVWRGPTWINANWYLARGLYRHGRTDLARTITDSSVALVEQSGFREYYDPRTGDGHGAPDFSWSALALDLLLTTSAADA